MGDADKRYGGGSTPYAEVPKRFKGAVLKTASTGDRGVGSNPTFRAKCAALTQMAEYHTFNVRVMGSNPISCTNSGYKI